NQPTPMTISTIEVFGDYQQSNNCGSTLAAGTSCTVNVTFSPAAIGSRPGTLSVNANIVNSPMTVSLSGAGIAPYVLSPSSLVFGNQTVGTPSATKTVTVKNNQSGTVAVSGVDASGDFSQSNNCGGSLAAGGSCTFNLTFQPSASGNRTGSLTFSLGAN